MDGHVIDAGRNEKPGGPFGTCTGAITVRELPSRKQAVLFVWSEGSVERKGPIPSFHGTKRTVPPFHQSSEKYLAKRRINSSPIIEKLIEEGAASLKALSSKIDTDKMYAPSFLMVLTGTGDYAYRRQDGVLVVPIGCLKN